MKKIIVPIDFSKHSEYALEAASILAKKNNSQILALHMLEMSDSMLINSDNEQHAKAVFFLKRTICHAISFISIKRSVAL